MPPKGPPYGMPPSMRRGMIRREPEPERILVSDRPINMSHGSSLGENRTNPTADFLESGSVGTSRIVPPNGPTAPWTPFIDIRTDDRKSLPLTVTLANTLSNAAPAFVSRGQLEARMVWGAGGGSAETIIDFVNGSTFVVVCSALTIDVRNTYVVGSSDVFNLSVFVAKGAKNNGFSPQRTIRQDDFIAATIISPVFNIPDFAKTLRIMTQSEDNTSSPAYDVVFSTQFNEAFQNHIGRNQICPDFRLGADFTKFYIQNRGPEAMTFRAIFELAI